MTTDLKIDDREEARTANTGFASGGMARKVGDLCFYSSSVVVDSLVLRPARTQNLKSLAEAPKKNKFATILRIKVTFSS